MQNLMRNTAWFYDVDNRDNLYDDLPFYIEYANATCGEVLELGCGTGRVALSLAKEGFNVTGLDLSKEMLDVFKSKLLLQPELSGKITVVHEDMSNFNFNKKFFLIIAPFRAFQALTDDNAIENCLKCIKEHLTDDGIFIVNVFNPRLVMDESWCYPEIVQWKRLDEKTGNYVVKKHWGDRIDTEKQIIYPHFAYEVTDKNDRTMRITDDLMLKYYYEKQLQKVIEEAGLSVLERFGWYDKKSIEDARRELIFVCGRNKE